MRSLATLALAAAVTLCLAPLARAGQTQESVAVLIAEKARAEMGVEMPAQGRFDVTMTTATPTRAELVSAFWMDRTTSQFAANVVTDDGETRRVYGLAVLNVPVPVPTRRIMPGEILSQDEFQTITLPYARLSSFSITSLDHLDGMQVRQVLAAGRPVLTQQVSPPMVVARGARVSIRFTSGRLSLTAPGRAITSAEADQPVRVVNLASNRTVTGIARPGGIVEVTK